MDVTIIRSNRKSIAIQVKPDLTVVVRAPYRVAQREIEKLIEEKNGWIEKQLQKFREQKEAKPDLKAFTGEEIRELAERACVYIPERVQYFAPIVGVDYRSITIRNQRSRWGSCSARGGLNFNCLLMLTPPAVIDYVVVHELCHRKEMNHSKAFWNEVQRVMPDYKEAKRWLKENGSGIIGRLR